VCVDLTVALLLLVDLSVTLVAGGVTVGVFRRTERVADRLGALSGLVAVAVAVLLTLGLSQRRFG
jgi:hypothetical protein